MKASEIREMPTAEVKQLIAERRKGIYELHSKAVTGNLPNPNLIRAYRKDIARCLTLLTERERAGDTK